MIERFLYSHEHTYAYVVGVVGGLWNVVLLQTIPTETLFGLKDPVAYATLIALSGVMVTVFTTRSVAALNKLAELPSKEELFKAIDKLGDKVDERHDALHTQMVELGTRLTVVETLCEVQHERNS